MARRLVLLLAHLGSLAVAGHVLALSVRFAPLEAEPAEARPIGAAAEVPESAPGRAMDARRAATPVLSPGPRTPAPGPGPAPPARPPREEQFHAGIRESLYHVDVDGDTTRTFRDPGPGYRSDTTITYDDTGAGGPQVRGLLALRATDDREIHADGNKVRLDGQFLEVARDGRYRAIAGDVVPEFSRYSLAHVGQGALVSRDLGWSGGVGRVTGVHARLERERSPVAFRRWATGARLGHTSTRDGRSSVTLGGSYVNVRDIESSITETALVAATPRDEIVSADAVFDHPSGLRAEAELARSRSTISIAGASTARRGRAQRELLSYNRPRGSIVLEHERIDPTFDSPASFASVDLDRQAASAFWAASSQMRVDANWVRVYSDITGSLGRGVENESTSGALTFQPFDKLDRGLLHGLTVSLLGRNSVAESTDATTDRSTRENVVTISHRYRRLGMTVSRGDLDSVDRVTAASSRRNRNVTVQTSYDVSGREGRWRATPFLTVSRDRDRAPALNVIDRGRSVSAGVDGAIGSRHQFRVARYESLQRLFSFDRRSFLETWQADWTWRPYERRDLALTASYAAQDNEDSSQGTVQDDRVLFSMYQRW